MELAFLLRKFLNFINKNMHWLYILSCSIIENIFWKHRLLFRLLLMMIPSIIYIWVKIKHKSFDLLSAILLFVGTFGYMALNAHFSSTSTETNFILIGIGSLFWGLSLFFEKAKQQK